MGQGLGFGCFESREDVKVGNIRYQKREEY